MNNGHLDMILQVLPDTRQMVHRLDAMLFQVIDIAEAGNHKSLGVLIAPAVTITSRSACSSVRLPLSIDFDPDGALAVENDAQHTDAGLNGKVSSLASRLEIAHGGASAASVARIDLVETAAFLMTGIEIRIVRQARLLAGLHPDAAHRVRELLVGNRQRAVRSVQFVGEAVVGFATLVVGQDIVPAPAFGPGGLPLIVVARLASQIDHGVDGASAAQHPRLHHCRVGIAGMARNSESTDSAPPGRLDRSCNRSPAGGSRGSCLPAPLRASKTETSGSSLSRDAKTQPDEPPPTTMKSGMSISLG